MKKMNKKGFTIVELVIVIAVIAILAGVMIPTFSGAVSNAKKSAAIQKARNSYAEYVANIEYGDGDTAATKAYVKVEDSVYVKYDNGTFATDTIANTEAPGDKILDDGTVN